MTLRISGKNIDIGEALRSQIEARVAAALSKYFDHGYNGHVTVEKEGPGFRSDCVLHLNSGMTLEATGRAQDAYIAFDQTAERIEKRLRRYKRRLKDRHVSNGSMNGHAVPEAAYTVIESPTDSVEETGEFHPVVIAETTKPLHSISVSDAVQELDLSGAPVVVFRHAVTGRVNVVYRRRDNAIGWVDPPVGD